MRHMHDLIGRAALNFFPDAQSGGATIKNIVFEKIAQEKRESRSWQGRSSAGMMEMWSKDWHDVCGMSVSGYFGKLVSKFFIKTIEAVFKKYASMMCLTSDCMQKRF